MTGDPDAFDALPPHAECVTVGGVDVPVVCRDRIDETALTDAVEVLDAHGVSRYRVSPVGSLQVGVGVHRPDEAIATIRTELSTAGHGVSTHGAARGFVRLRVALTED